MNIIKYKSVFLGLAGVLVLASVVMLSLFGLKTGIDFKGGTLWQLKIASSGAAVNEAALKDFFAQKTGESDIIVSPAEGGSYLVRSKSISEEDHRATLNALRSSFGSVEELQFQSIGPTVGQELKSKAFWAIIYVILGISLYVTYAFRKVSYPVKSWKYGVITLATLFHDVVIPAGFFAFLGMRYGIEIDTNFVVALLVVMGFSVHDTIVVFDRIRENLMTHSGGAKFPEIVNKSINQTFARSLNTSLTVMIVLLFLYFFGPATIHYFILTLIIGIAMGTYSSIFVASPLLTIWQKLSKV